MLALASRGKQWSVPAPILRVVIPLAGLVSPMFRSGVNAVLSTFGRTSPSSRGGQIEPGSKPGLVNPAEKQGDDSI